MREKDIKDHINDINTILENIQDKDRTLTFIKQRGYLTGWLARLALTDPMIRLEIRQKLKQISENKK